MHEKAHALGSRLGEGLRQHLLREVDRRHSRFLRRATDGVTSGARTDVEQIRPGDRPERTVDLGLLEREKPVAHGVVRRRPGLVRAAGAGVSENLRLAVAGQGVLQRIDALFEFVEEGKVRIDNVIDDRVEKKVSAVDDQTFVAAEAIANGVDRAHGRAMNGEEKIRAEE